MKFFDILVCISSLSLFHQFYQKSYIIFLSILHNSLNFCSEFCLPTYIFDGRSLVIGRPSEVAIHEYLLQCSLELVTSNLVAVLQKIVFNLLHKILKSSDIMRFTYLVTVFWRIKISLNQECTVFFHQNFIIRRHLRIIRMVHKNQGR